MVSSELLKIVHAAGMSSRPGFYSGRGATISDLTSNILEYIYAGIKSHFGDEAADNFVSMVASLPVLAATDFLVCLYRLEANGWKWSPEDVPRGPLGLYTDPDLTDDQKAAQGMGYLMSTLFGGPTPDDPGSTNAIRDPFLWAHQKDRYRYKFFSFDY